MRTRDWRRFQEEKKYRRRIKKFHRKWWYFHTANGDRIIHPIWSDFIGLKDFHFYKSGTTREYDSKYKVKYSPNKNVSYYRDSKSKETSYGLREKDKILVKKIIKEYWHDRYSED
jgi:hypothetical protein